MTFNLDGFRTEKRKLQEEHDRLRAPLVDKGPDSSHVEHMSDERLARLEGSYDALKVVRPMTIAVLAIFIAVMVGGFAFLGTQVMGLGGQLSALNSKVDGIPQRLSEEFGRMRAEMSAQTSAIANSITATKQAPPQVILMPAPTAAPAVTPAPTAPSTKP